jgi:hypothetical protein
MVKFKIGNENYVPGDIAGFPNDIGKELVKQKIAEFYLCNPESKRINDDGLWKSRIKKVKKENICAICGLDKNKKGKPLTKTELASHKKKIHAIA